MQLDLETSDQHAPEMTKSAYARYSELSNGRISQLIKDGMPVLPNGRILVKDADDWINANIKRRASDMKSETYRLASAKVEREEAQRDLLRLQVAEKERRLVDRKAVELALFERARGERDAHLAWVSRIASQIASELDVDLSLLFSVLDREMRDHLTELAETPLDDLKNA